MINGSRSVHHHEWRSRLDFERGCEARRSPLDAADVTEGDLFDFPWLRLLLLLSDLLGLID